MIDASRRLSLSANSTGSSPTICRIDLLVA
jgi:hypothetical protein